MARSSSLDLTKRLGTEFVESFLRVAPTADVEADGNFEEEEVRIVLRSGGEPLMSPLTTGSENALLRQVRAKPPPPFAVGLAHHIPTDAFILFAFSADVLPCRLVRFDRDGKKVDRRRPVSGNKGEANADAAAAMAASAPPHLWSRADASALFAAARCCAESGYFDAAGGEDAADGLKGSAGASATDRSGCLRLVPRTNGGKANGPSSSDSVTIEDDDGNSNEDEDDDDDEEEAAASVRALILNHLLHPAAGSVGSARGATSDFIRHPDPNFLLPLSRSISGELKRWRALYRDLPPTSAWQRLPPDTGDGEEEGKEQEEEKAEVGGKTGTVERQEFDEIMSERTGQVERMVGLCRGALGRMRSFLLKVVPGDRSCANRKGAISAFPSAFQLGRECVGSLAALEQFQKSHWDDWAEYHEALGEACEDMSRHGTADDENALTPWLAKGEDDDNSNIKREAARGDENENVDSSADDCDDEDDEDNEKGNGEGSSEEEDGDAVASETIESASRAVINAWLEDDASILCTLSSAISTVEEAVLSGDRASQTAAVDSIRSVEEKLTTGKEEMQRRSIANVARLVQIWNARHSDEEYEDDEEYIPWLKIGAWPCWTKEQEEAHVSFGQRVDDGREKRAPPSFAVDHTGLAACLKDCVRGFYLSPNGRSEYEDYDYFKQDERFDRGWRKFVKPTLDDALATIGNFIDAGDLHNASLLVTSCCRFLCGGKTAGTIREWFDDPDGSYGSNKMIISQFRKEMERFDVYAIKITLRYCEQEKFESYGARWFYNVLNSGMTWFPTHKGAITWTTLGVSSLGRSREAPLWRRYAHPAAAVFDHGGWRHPILCRAFRGCISAIRRWSNLEAPIVVKERFAVMKFQGKKEETISLARMMGGDHEALHFLVTNGLANDAISQASCSGNNKGLARLASDLIGINLPASFVCMQAHLLGATEAAKVDEGCQKYPPDSIVAFVDLFIRQWLVPQSDMHVNPTDDSFQLVPSLQHLSVMAATRAFLCAAESTEKMQIILETHCFKQDGILLAIAAIAVITRVTSSEGLEFALSRAGLFSSENSKVDGLKYSGYLTHFDTTPESPCQEHLVRICSAVFECTKFLLEKDIKSMECFEIAMFSSVYLAVQSGCQTFALLVVETVRNCDKNAFDRYHRRSLLNTLTACFSSFFCSIRAHRVCPELPELLLETFLNLRSSDFMNLDARMTQPWVALAYAQYNGAEEAGSLLAEHVFLNQNFDRSYEDFDAKPTEVLKELSVIDVDMAEGGPQITHHTMSMFASSSHRTHFAASERKQICSAYTHQLFSISSSMGIHLGPAAIAECVRINVKHNPTFWHLESHQVEHRLSNLTGLALCLSKRESLVCTCSVIFFVDQTLRSGETWGTKYFMFACGLSWLRSALLAHGELPAFDHTREELSGFRYDRFNANYTSLYGEDDWRYNRRYGSRPPNILGRNHVFAAYALVTALKRHALMVEDSDPHLSEICQEALSLCEVMHFLLHPTPQKLQVIVHLTSTLRSSLQPEILLNAVLDSKWGTKSEFALRTLRYGQHADEEKKMIVPFLVPRVCLALQHGKVKAAVTLCIIAGKSDSLWDSLSKRSEYYVGRATPIARQLLQGCLLTLSHAAVAQGEVSDEFVSIAMHVILTMNWFRCCTKCSTASSGVSEYSDVLVPSSGNIEALHESALAWMEVDESKRDSDTALTSCANMVRCLSRCCRALDGSNSQTECDHCCLKRDDTSLGAHSDVIPATNARDERAERRKKRRREHVDDFEADFKMLQMYIAQVHSKEASDWCSDSLRRVRAAANAQTSKKRAARARS